MSNNVVFSNKLSIFTRYFLFFLRKAKLRYVNERMFGKCKRSKRKIKQKNSIYSVLICFFQKTNTIYSYAEIESGGLLTKSTAQNTYIKQIEPPETVRTAMISFILWQTYRFGNTWQHTFTAAVFTAQKKREPFSGGSRTKKNDNNEEY